MQINGGQESRVALAEERIRTAKTFICEHTVRRCVTRFGDNLCAIVLSGSLARGEATFVEEGSRLRLLGDADFFAVIRNGAPSPASDEIELIEREVGLDLSEGGVMATVGLGVVSPSYLERLPPFISTFELRFCGEVIFGDRAILFRIPSFDRDEISREDAWRMLANRMIELLEVLAPEAEGDQLPCAETHYRTLKLFLDMATSYLVFTRRYRPTYRQRDQELRRLASEIASSSDAPFPLPSFAEAVSQCTRFKLNEGPMEAPPSRWREAVYFAHLLWRWELKQLTGETVHLSHSELMSQWMKHQPLKYKARGWASAVRRLGWRRSWRHAARWIRLSWYASPRYWIYSAAVEVFFELPRLTQETTGMTWKMLSYRLPMTNESRPQLQGLVRLITANYRHFLENTAA
jgi:predicted nucleotidyltransferase